MDNPISIDSRGYGRIFKTVMRSRQLPLLAKAIYSYFCSYAGNGNQAYPKRDKTVRNLNINKDTYTKHLALLVSGGYIVKERTVASNLYTIMRTVPGYESPVQADNEMTDMLVMENVNAKGFGTVPSSFIFHCTALGNAARFCPALSAPFLQPWRYARRLFPRFPPRRSTRPG